MELLFVGGNAVGDAALTPVLAELHKATLDGAELTGLAPWRGFAPCAFAATSAITDVMTVVLHYRPYRRDAEVFLGSWMPHSVAAVSEAGTAGDQR